MRKISITRNGRELTVKTSLWRKIRCSHRSLSKLTTIIRFPNCLTKLTLVAPNVTVILGPVFRQLEQLQIVHLDLPNLQEIPGQMFANLSRLVDLILKFNSISNFEADIFDGNCSLQSLQILSANSLFPIAMFEKLTRLQKLDIREVNNLKIYFHQASFDTRVRKPILKLLTISCPSFFYLNLQKAKRLHLANSTTIYGLKLNKIETIVYLNLSNIESQFLTGVQFGRLKQLKVLIVSHNEIRTLSLELIDNLPCLRHLDLRNCEISETTGFSFGHTAPMLAYLALSHNLIDSSHLNPELFLFSCHLRKLDLSFNQIRELPSSKIFESLQNLQILLLNNNVIEALLLLCFARLSNLVLLDLSYNMLGEFHSNWFQKRCKYNLEIFNLNNNCLSTIRFKKNLFLRKLRVLNLSANSILGFNCKTFEFLPLLQKLNLAQNRIQSLSKHVFSKLIHLQFLYLGSNDLQHIDSMAFQKLISLKLLKLQASRLSESILQHLHFYRRVEIICSD